MEGPVKDIKQKMEMLRKAYVEQLPERIKEIDLHCEKLLQNICDNTVLKNLHRIVHSIKGSSASFGYSAISSAASSLDRLLKPAVDAKSVPDNELIEALEKQVLLLKEVVANLNQRDPKKDDVVEHYPSRNIPEEHEKKLIYLVDDDPSFADMLSLQIRHFGYTVKVFARLDELRDAVKEMYPSAIIADIVFPDGSLAGTAAIAEIQKSAENLPPVIFITCRTDINARLESVRAGAAAYFVKPINITELIDKLDSLTTYREPEPYRVLIIDDEPELAAYHSLILEQAGMKTAIVNDPLAVFDPLIEFRPDLLLMDVYMPDCDGMELARVIRQMGVYFSIPIVFLSGETSLDKQISAMSMGGDEFLTKPIKPEHLISSVVVRAERMRVIRSFMERDSLTGLLNHTKTKEQLDIAVSRAKRLGNHLCFAMIDIDKFKSVNDTYGHPAGDRVIVALSRLLQQRLRKTDVVGRYGGEEFAVILSDTDSGSAFKVLDAIRLSFSEIVHQSEGKEFSSSFSCGIAIVENYTDSVDLNNAADKALYEAKHGGRNRVVVLEGSVNVNVP